MWLVKLITDIIDYLSSISILKGWDDLGQFLFYKLYFEVESW